MLLARRQMQRPPSIVVLRVCVDRPIIQKVFDGPDVARRGGCDNLGTIIDAGACVEIKILRRVRIVAWSSTPSTRRLFDSVVVLVPHRSIEPGRLRQRREMT